MLNKIDVLIWDLDKNPCNSDRSIILWSGLSENEIFFSITKFVEDNSLLLRTKYLKWVFELGEINISDKSLIENLKIRENFSFWWLTQISEKCNFDKSPQIDNVIKLFAFIEWSKGKKIESLEIVSINVPLIKCLNSFCEIHNIQFVNRNKIVNLKEYIKQTRIIVFIRTIYWLFKYFIKNFKIVISKSKLWKNSKSEITIISYLFNINVKALYENKFESYYWGTLPNILSTNGLKTRWLHLYVGGGIFKNIKEANTKLNELSFSNNDNQEHILLESFLSVNIFIKAIIDWFRIIRKHSVLKKSIIRNKYEQISLFPFFEKDAMLSIYGINALDNLLKLHLFKAAFNGLLKQNTGIYLQENQGWEVALNYNWKESGHNRLIAFPHSTVRFWDLRYYFDYRLIRKKILNNLPFPDLIACNGEVIKKNLIDGGYNSEDLVEAESLRYLDLLKINHDSELKSFRYRENINLLVLGDYSYKKTVFQLLLLENAFPKIQRELTIRFKPHPACPINIAQYSKLNMKLVTEPLYEVLDWADVTFSSETTSAAVDSFISGKEVLIALNFKALNFSPLKDFENVYFLSNSNSLADHLNSFSCNNPMDKNRNEFFYLDKELPKWKKLLEI
jgi:surface carbohydrate biosynthesis protein (TIGR04326 family)